MSYGAAPSRSATTRTRSAGTNKNVASLSMKWLMNQGPAIRSPRARSWVTHFIGVRRPARRPLFRPLRLLAVGQLERGFQSLGELDWIVIGPEMHVEEPRHIRKSVVMERRHFDAVLPQGPGNGIHFLVDEYEIAGDRGLPIGRRLEVHHRR